MRVGGTVEQSLVRLSRRQRHRQVSVARGEGRDARLDKLVRAPLIKADLWKGLPEFNQWAAPLQQLPSPALIHPVAFQSGGFDEAHPDFLPPDPRWGSSADFNSMAANARSLGQLVMPYLNVSWWDTTAPSVQALPSPLEPKDIAVQNLRGNPVTEQFGPHDGYIVSPHVSAVRKRIQGVFEEWKTDVPVDCLFFDQIGARPWRRDFNPAAPYAARVLRRLALVVRAVRPALRDGGGRLGPAGRDVLRLPRRSAADVAAVRMAERPAGAQGNWEPYPIAGFLFGDKVLMYQHDLYEPTMTIDPETLLFNVAFGFVLSYAWDGEREEASLTNPWATLVGQVQRTLGPHYAGKRLTGFRSVAPNVTESMFEGGFSRASQLEAREARWRSRDSGWRHTASSRAMETTCSRALSASPGAASPSPAAPASLSRGRSSSAGRAADL